MEHQIDIIKGLIEKQTEDIFECSNCNKTSQFSWPICDDEDTYLKWYMMCSECNQYGIILHQLKIK